MSLAAADNVTGTSGLVAEVNEYSTVPAAMKAFWLSGEKSTRGGAPTENDASVMVEVALLTSRICTTFPELLKVTSRFPLGEIPITCPVGVPLRTAMVFATGSKTIIPEILPIYAFVPARLNRIEFAALGRVMAVPTLLLPVIGMRLVPPFAAA